VRTLEVADRIELGATADGRPWPRAPPRFRQFGLGRARRFHEALLELCRADRAGSRGDGLRPPRSKGPGGRYRALPKPGGPLSAFTRSGPGFGPSPACRTGSAPGCAPFQEGAMA